MSKTVDFVLLDQFSDWQLGYLPAALSMLGDGQYEVRILAENATKPVSSLGGIDVMPNGGLDAISKDAAGLVLIGALAWKTQASQQVVPFVVEFAKTGKPLGAISDAVSVLATLGILNDRAHTANSEAELTAWAREYTGQKLFEEKPAVRDGNLVTANGSAVLEFTREMLVALGISEARAAEWYSFNKGGMGGDR